MIGSMALLIIPRYQEMFDVSYTLMTSHPADRGYPLLQIKARNYSGSCEPNVLDEMAALLATMASE